MRTNKFNILTRLLILSALALGLAACGGGGSGSEEPSTGNNIDPIIVKQEVVDNISSADSFNGAFGEGFVHVCPGTETASQPRNFLFKVHGFAPNTVNRIPKTGELEKACDSLPADRNYHVFEARYRNGGDYIQRNSGFIRALLDWAVTKYKITTADRVAVVGYSMGGIVSRYALLSMLTAGIENKIDLYVTVDSPHYGAYTPIGVQTIANVFADLGGNEALKAADSFAARQMLRYHYTQGSSTQTWTNDFQQLYIDELLGAFGGFPTADGLRTVAVSSGRSDGQLVSPAPGQLYYSGINRTTERHTIAKRSGGISLCTVTFSATTIDIDVDLIAKTYALGINKGATTTVASTDVIGYVVKLNSNGSRGSRISIENRTALTTYFETRVSKSGIGCFVVDVSPFVAVAVDKAVDEGKAQAKSQTAAYDNKKYITYNDGSSSEGVPGGLGFDIATLRTTLSNAKFVQSSDPAMSPGNSHSFIPLGSALGIDDLDPVTLAGLQLSDLALMSPFTQIYVEPNANLDHLKSTSGWFLSEVNALFDK